MIVAKYAVCGLGPAGVGFIFACYRAKILEKMIADGLLLVDSAVEPGAGELANYCITANTTAGTFLECLNDDHAGIFDDLLRRNDGIIDKLRQDFSSPVDLSIIGEFLTLITSKMLEYVAGLGAQVLLETRLNQIYCREQNTYRLVLHDFASNNSLEADVERIVLNLGAGQDPQLVNAALIENFGAAGAVMAQKSVMADTVLKSSRNLLPTMFDDLSQVLIIGSSHSALSVVERITEVDHESLETQISLLQRSPIRLFYPSLRVASEAGYLVDPETDVCPLTGGVNRYGGLRFAAREVGLQILKQGTAGKHNRQIGVSIVPVNETSPSELLRLAENASVVIPCLGYSPNTLPMFDSEGEPFNLALDGFGFRVSPNGLLYDDSGRPMRAMYSFGIGAGLRTSPEIGGERSFTKRVDGVWLYHFDIGARVVAAFLKNYEPIGM